MSSSVFLTTTPLFMHFRQTHPDYVGDSEAEAPDFLLRGFDGHRYSARLSKTIVDTNVKLLKEIHKALRVQLTKAEQRLSASDANAASVLEANLDPKELIQTFDLEAERVDEGLLEDEIDAWKEAAIEHSIDAVIQHIEEYLTGQVDIPPRPSTRLRLRYVTAGPSAMMSQLKDEFGQSTGVTVAAGISWYDDQAEGLDMTDEFPIVSTQTATEYQQQDEIYNIITKTKDSSNYTPPCIVCVREISY